MKKMAKITTIALMLSVLTGCKKDYMCSCTTMSTPVNYSLDQLTNVDLGKMKNDQAVAACTGIRTEANTINAGYTTYSATVHTDCVLL